MIIYGTGKFTFPLEIVRSVDADILIITRLFGILHQFGNVRFPERCGIVLQAYSESGGLIIDEPVTGTECGVKPAAGSQFQITSGIGELARIVPAGSRHREKVRGETGGDTLGIVAERAGVE